MIIEVVGISFQAGSSTLIIMKVNKRYAREKGEVDKSSNQMYVSMRQALKNFLYNSGFFDKAHKI
jgi:hypothetical protein